MVRADAPGRVNLIGEHTDYNEGFVLPTAIPQRTSIVLEPRPGNMVTVASEGFAPLSFALGAERRAGDWGDYVRGITWALRDAGLRIGAFDARVRSDVPAGAGLSASAALEVAVLRALRAAFALELDDVRLALVAHRAESVFVGARVGTMDQLAASLAHEGEAILIDTRTLTIDRLRIPEGVALVVVDSGIAHAHATGGYNARREECEAAARALGVGALRDVTHEGVARLAASSPALARRAGHVVTEDARVLAFVDAVRRGDLSACGRLLDESHASLRDDFEVSLPECDELAALLRGQAGVYGARLVGGGFGGSVLALARADASRAAAERAAAAYTTRTGAVARVLLPV